MAVSCFPTLLTLSSQPNSLKMSRFFSDEYIKQHQVPWHKFYQHVNETKQESAWKRDLRYAALTMGASAERNLTSPRWRSSTSPTRALLCFSGSRR